MIKRRLSETLNARSFQRQNRALMLKVITHNLMIVLCEYWVFYRALLSPFSLGLAHGSAEAQPIRLVRDINPGLNSKLQKFTVVDDRLFFVADDGVNGLEIWTSDGTFQGTRLVKDIQTGTTGLAPSNLRIWNGLLYFSQGELWRSDGTDVGTTVVLDINPGDSDSIPAWLTLLDNTLLFVADDGVHGRELWKSDGTGAGTIMVADLEPGSAGSEPGGLTRMQNLVYFSAFTASTGRELWSSDGQSISLVADVIPGPTGSNLSPRLVSGNRLFMTGPAPDGPDELWVTDGTAQGTVFVKDIAPGITPSSMNGFFAFNGLAIFSANVPGSGFEPWRSDGTSNGTYKLAEVTPGSGGSLASNFVEYDGRLFFAVNEPIHRQCVWSTDGTTQGTRFDFDFVVGSSTDVMGLFTRGPYLFVIESAIGGQGVVVIRTNGTASGSQVIANENLQGGILWVNQRIAVANDRVFMNLSGAQCGYELFAMDINTCYPTGDLNFDGASDGRDIATMTAAILGAPVPPAQLCHFDLNANGLVDAGDIPPFIDFLFSDF